MALLLNPQCFALLPIYLHSLHISLGCACTEACAVIYTFTQTGKSRFPKQIINTFKVEFLLIRYHVLHLSAGALLWHHVHFLKFTPRCLLSSKAAAVFHLLCLSCQAILTSYLIPLKESHLLLHAHDITMLMTP